MELNENLVAKTIETYSDLQNHLNSLSEFLAVANPNYANSDKELLQSISEAQKVIEVLKTLKIMSV